MVIFVYNMIIRLFKIQSDRMFIWYFIVIITDFLYGSVLYARNLPVVPALQLKCKCHPIPYWKQAQRHSCIMENLFVKLVDALRAQIIFSWIQYSSWPQNLILERAGGTGKKGGWREGERQREKSWNTHICNITFIYSMCSLTVPGMRQFCSPPPLSQE